MKNLINKVCNHGKKITIHLKRHHRKYLFVALCSGILALIFMWHSTVTYWQVSLNIRTKPGAEWWVSWNIVWGTVVVEYISGDIVYEDTNWLQFTGIWTIKIISGTTAIAMLDRNLWALKPWTWCSLDDSWACWYHFQWGNNYWFNIFDDITENVKNYDLVNIDTSINWPGNYYVSWTFITDSTWWNAYDRSIVRNDNLWWWSGDFNSNWQLPILNVADRQWPCPDGFHIPSKWEWLNVIEMIWNDADKFRNTLLMPTAWYRQYDDGVVRESSGYYDENQIYWDRLWSSSPNSSDDRMANNLFFDGVRRGVSNNWWRSNGFSIRCFQNTWDDISPTCNVLYSTTGTTSHDVVAYLTWCSEFITWTSLQHVFHETWTYTFEFQDLFGNTWSANATVTWIERGDTYENAKSLYNEYKEITCSGSYNSGWFDSQFSIYLNSWMLSQRSSNTYSWKTNVDYLLAKDDLMCLWWDSYWKWYWVCTDYNFNIESIMWSMFPMSTGNDSVSCEIWLQDTGLFVLPDDITFNIVGQNNFALSWMFHNSANSFWVDSFYIKIPESFDVWEAVDFSVRAMKDGKTFTWFFGLIFISLKDEDGNDVKEKYYTLSDGAYYQFISDDLWKKTFEDWLIVKKEWKYILRVDSIYWWMWDFEIVVGERNDEDDNEDNDDFEYDTLKFNPYFSDEDNMAYQYAYHYWITTTSSIKNANMYSGLNRIAMAKMLSNYAENVLWMDDFDTSRNCKFADVSTSLDASYDYWVTKACQLWIMWINVPNNRFYPNWRVTRAEFATALSRLLYNTEDGVDNYYTTHINKLRREWIITNTNPQLWEKRWFVMLMLMRAGEIYDD